MNDTVASHYLDLVDNTSKKLDQAYAMSVAMTDEEGTGFHNFSIDIKHDFIWALQDKLKSLIELFDAMEALRNIDDKDSVIPKTEFAGDFLKKINDEVDK